MAEDNTKKATYCAYCGDEFPLDADGTADAVSEHIQNCPKHPIQGYKKEIDRLDEAHTKQRVKAEALAKKLGEASDNLTEIKGNLKQANTELQVAREAEERAHGRLGEKVAELETVKKELANTRTALRGASRKLEKRDKEVKELREALRSSGL